MASGKEGSPGEKELGSKGSGALDQKQKPPFRLVQDDTKPVLRDPILRSDPMETEQAVLRLPALRHSNIQNK